MVNWLKVCSVAFLASLIVSGCAQTSGGMVLGVKGSPAWFKFAPKSDVRMHVDSMSTVRLCSGWADAWETPIVREAISGALVRRGKESMYCYNPQEDSMRRSEMRARQAEAAKKRELREMQRELDDMDDALDDICRALGKIRVGSQCI